MQNLHTTVQGLHEASLSQGRNHRELHARPAPRTASDYRLGVVRVNPWLTKALDPGEVASSGRGLYRIRFVAVVCQELIQAAPFTQGSEALLRVWPLEIARKQLGRSDHASRF